MATKLYNKIEIREHPDLSPFIDSSFQKGHSFIFPGDEIVACTKIKAPEDIGGDFSSIILKSVKMSVIAKKPNIFTEEYSSEFAATRSFELDSETIVFDNSNSPNVLWGSDGYAPNINFQLDRNWQLPSGNFKRQIKAFTEHTGGSSDWYFNFYFPFIFREDYWNALIVADNDFYDNELPQNGQNEKWLRYHDLTALPFGWLIKYKFELFYSQSGFDKSIVSEWNLSNEQTGIQDYESNTDYTLRSIKTCIVDGTPSNTPNAYIFGDRNTSCFGYFTKQTAWDSGEKDLLTAIFRVRPFESGDRLGSRGSSKYGADSQVVWVGNSQQITTDSGGDLLTDFGDPIIVDDNPVPTEITFDPMDDKNIIVKAEIDYKKLAIIFPGVNNFTLYCRLYNGKIKT